MKACFHLQRRFAYVGHEIATLLKERHGVTEFCGYVFTRTSYEFLKNQTDISYTSLLLDDEIHHGFEEEILDWDFLQSLERDYGIPNLWPYIEIDRIVRYGQLVREYPYNTPPYTHHEMLQILQRKAKKVIEFLETEKPDFIFYSAIGSTASLLLYTIAKKKGIRIVHLLSPRIKSEHLLSEHYSMFTGFDGVVPSEEDYARARAFLEEFRRAPAPYTVIDSIREKPLSRSLHFKFLSPRRAINSIRFAYTQWTSFFSDPARRDYSTIKPWHQAFDRARRKIRILIGYDDLYDTPTEGENYAYYPLHMEPEVVTMLYAPVYNDQLWVAKQIAKSLPVGYTLYIKEHLAMFGFRTRAFYKELKKIPNVKLISPKKSSFDLIQNAKLITNLTGTVGWEALLLKKPVITFGEIFYNALSGVRQCKDMYDLPQLIREQLESFEHNEKELVEFIAKIYHESVSLDLVDLWERERGVYVKERREEMMPLANLIMQKVRN